MVRNVLVIITVIIIFVLGMVGCSEQNTQQPIVSNPSSLPPNSKIIMVNHFVFEPGEIIVNAGEVVTWIHNDNVAHKIVSTDGLFESDVVNKGAEFTYTFDKPGEYNYYCSIHPSMTGKIIVK